MKIQDTIKLLRPRHYVKNIFIFLPLFFSGQIGNLFLLGRAGLAFIAFSCAASSIYIINDIQDVEEDRLHPEKKKRPLASGLISKLHAQILMVILMILGLGISAYISQETFLLILFYCLLNMAYSFKLKHISLIDVTIIAIGFVLRLFVGSAATDVPLSKWIVIMTFLLSLFLALAKRRDDILIISKTGNNVRKVMGEYNLALVDSAMMIMASVVIVSYLLYATSAEVIERLHSDHLYLTGLFVIIGILRYLQISFVEYQSGSPTKVLYKDKFIQISILGWLISFIWILYINK